MSLTKNNIICLPNPSLRTRSKKVGLITPAVRQLIDDMKSATLDWEDHRHHEIGVALAAVQVDQLLRIVIVRTDIDNKADRTFQVFINPEITKYEGEVVADFEGCLSIKDIYGKVPRHSKVRLRALNAEGRPIRMTADGFLARVFQHEIDHTNGIVFVDHIKNNADAFFNLGQDGELTPLDYEKAIRNNDALWE